MIPKTISATSINTYNECPKKWQYKYQYKLLEPDNPAFIIGTAFHKAVEMYHSPLNSSYKNDDEILEELKKTVMPNKTKEEIDRYACVRKMFEKYKENPLILDSDEQKMEYQFSIPLNSLLGESINLFGYIDRITDKQIVDYKTTSQDYTDEELAKNIQTDIYSYVFWREKEKMPEVVYYVMNKKKANNKSYKPQVFILQRTVEDMKVLEDKFKEFFDNIINERFEPCPNDHCFWCPWRENCSK
jgi:hypothetical protein